MYHSLSYYKIYKKWKIQRRKKKKTNLNYPKLENGDKTTLKYCISLNTEPQGVYIGTRGKGGQGTNPDPKYGRVRARTAAKTRPRPCFRRSSRAARAAPAAARCRVCPLSAIGPGF